jgi:hypothetical protein
MAWLSSVPTPATSGHHARLQQPARDQRTRAQRLQDDGVDDMPTPPVLAGAALLDWFWDVGPVAHGGMGPVPIGYADLQAWAAITGTPLQPWQAAVLRRMSRAYVAELRTAEAADAPPPWAAAPTQQQRDAVARRMRDALGQRATTTPKGLQ